MTHTSATSFATETSSAERKARKGTTPSSWQHNWFVLTSLVSKDFKLKYRRSLLGVLWSVLNPLLMMVVLAAVFSYMFRFSIDHYPLYLILGTVWFDFMSRATSSAMSSIIESQSLIKKIRIEKMLFPIEKVFFELVNTAISLVAVIAVMVYHHVFPTPWALLCLPFILLCTFIFSVGIGLILSALSVFFRDVMHLWGVVITAWTYLTPIFYPVDMLDSWMKNIMQFNPMYHFINYLRSIMMWNTNPGILESAVCLGMALVVFALGMFIFRRTEKKFILYI